MMLPGTANPSARQTEKQGARGEDQNQFACRRRRNHHDDEVRRAKKSAVRKNANLRTQTE
jgi:hypothetical protein